MAIIYVGKWILPEIHFQFGFLNILSWLFFVGAIGLIVWSALWFFMKRTPIEPHHTPKTLIVEGPYRLSRNPIYLGLVIITLGSALGHGSIFGIASAALLWRILDARFVATEEAVLGETFGEEATKFFDQTRRWI